MKFVADLHLHSRYSRAVSQQMTIPNMAHWAKLKGINVLASADFTHPFWFEALKVGLEEAGNGLYRVKNQESRVEGKEVQFLLSAEISSIYSQGGKARRIHTLFMFPTLESVDKFNKELLKRRANLRSDGRPIVGISARDLAKIALECDDHALVIPAHAWTPWFSIFGSFSGFDSIEECFGDVAPNIYGIESGLSSDPGMNWQISDLDNRAILSFSDAHSLEKMGREATVFDAEEISYTAIYDAVRGPVGQIFTGPVADFPPVGARSGNSSDQINDDQSELRADRSPSIGTTRKNAATRNAKIAFTIEFYPEEGKYHFTGHRNCNYSQGPDKDKNAPCPVCGKSMTIGVMDRVEELKTNDSKLKTEEIDGVKWNKSADNRPPYVNLVPLGEIIAETYGVGVGTVKVHEIYMNLVSNLGSEFGILMKAGIGEIARFAGGRVAEAVAKVRKGEITIEPGYDNQFGIVKIWPDAKSDKVEVEDESQLNLFA